MALSQGTTLGPYEIVSLLGTGGMGEVYLARDPRGVVKLTESERAFLDKWLMDFMAGIVRRMGSSRTSGSGQCESGNYIESVSDDGDIIKLSDGSVWEVLGGDSIISTLWLPVSEVLVCGDKIINTDDNSERVSVTRLR